MLERTVETLFLVHTLVPPYPEAVSSVEEFTYEEVSDAIKRIQSRTTAPEPDAVLNRVWGLVNVLTPDWIFDILNRCLSYGEFPPLWKVGAY